MMRPTRIATVTVQIDETGGESAPCCSTRTDVAGAFPDQTNAELSGWGVVTNYGNLAEGEHTLTARIETEAGIAVHRSAHRHSLATGRLCVCGRV